MTAIENQINALKITGVRRLITTNAPYTLDWLREKYALFRIWLNCGITDEGSLEGVWKCLYDALVVWVRLNNKC